MLKDLQIKVPNDEEIPADLLALLINANLVYLCNQTAATNDDDDIKCLGLGKLLS